MLFVEEAERRHTILSALEVRGNMGDQRLTRDTSPPPPSEGTHSTHAATESALRHWPDASYQVQHRWRTNQNTQCNKEQLQTKVLYGPVSDYRIAIGLNRNQRGEVPVGKTDQKQNPRPQIPQATQGT